jgi:hypothetical protein
VTGQSKLIRGSVAIVTCRKCQANLPLFEFEVESDTGAVGLCSAAKCNSLDLVIAETTLDEWQALQSGSLSTLPSRLSTDPELQGFHVLHIKRIEKSPDPPAGIPFSEFRRLYKPPVVIYACPCCGGGAASKSQEMVISKFEQMGGRLIALGGLAVAR